MNTGLLFALLLAPLAGATLNLLGASLLPRRAIEALAVAGVAVSALCTLLLWPQAAEGLTATLYDWVRIDAFAIPLTLNFDRLSAAMALMVTVVATLIQLYAIGYMRSDPDYPRFFALLNLFVFAMLAIVLADDLILLFLGWEGVGFCSYALIGFWYRKAENADAGRKAFLVTRIGDVFLGIAILWLFSATGSLSLAAINGQAATLAPATLAAIGLLLLFGACGKSAQLPLSTWLPDAMAGPTPVSALIHAATMVTAGVYLLCRLKPLLALSPTVLAAIAVVGTATMLYAATCALAQHDLKRILAYSTMSQVGYMFLAVGVGTVGDALFHLLSHACFKAALFMGAGCIIALSGEHDIRRMGGMARRDPRLFALFLAAALCLAGLPPSGGFFSKDAILAATAQHPDPFHRLLLCLGLLGVFLTALYTFRLLYLVFAGEARGAGAGEPVAPGLRQTIIPLALAGLFAGGLNLPALLGGEERLHHWLAPQTPTHPLAPGAELLLFGISTGLGLAGWLVARARYRQGEERSRDFLLHGWRLDALYAALLLRPFAALARFCLTIVEALLIEGGLARLAALCHRGGELHGRLVNGRISRYLTGFACGLAVVAVWLAFTLNRE